MTTLIEAMKLALEALEGCYDVNEWPADGRTKQDHAITALRTAIAEAEKQEPVAWMIEWNGGPTGNLFRNKGYATREMQRLNMLRPQDRRRLVPLYTTPPAQEFVCSTGMCHYKAKRPWVGLTEQDLSAINQSCLTKLQAAISTEALLKALEEIASTDPVDAALDPDKAQRIASAAIAAAKGGA